VDSRGVPSLFSVGPAVVVVRRSRKLAWIRRREATCRRVSRGGAKARRKKGVWNLMKRQLRAAFVCFECRKVFKRPSHHRVGDGYHVLVRASVCPECQCLLQPVGDAFRAPRKDDSAAWKGVERAIRRGRTFVRDEQWERNPNPAWQRSSGAVPSLFQLPARKRGRIEPRDAAGSRDPATCP
jgi:hypothetical protein